MNATTMDLFSEPADPAAHAASAASPPEPRTPDLEDVMTACGRKASFKALTVDQATVLQRAVSAVSVAKRHAYTRAIAGEPPNLFGWLARQPALAAATAALNAAFIDSSSIAMSDAPA